MSADGSERRDAPRINDRCRIAYRALLAEGATERAEAAATVNLSASGLCMVTPAALDRDAHLALELDLEGHEDPVVAVGRVVWCDREDEAEAEHAGRYRVGVCFTWLRDEDRASLSVIADYVQDRLGG